MAIKIKCPYCFKIFDDDKVHFRFSYVMLDESERNKILPKGYNSITAVQMADESEISASKKEEIIRRYNEIGFYAPEMSEKYKKFWDKFNGEYTEIDPGSKRDDNKNPNERMYFRKVIDPNNAQHQIHLKEIKNGEFFIRDPEKNNMVTSIILADGDGSQSSMRVCPECHNPLPESYGLYPVKFFSIIGIVGAGKTVFLSQFLKKFPDYMAECGLVANKTTLSINEYIKLNKIAVGETLPPPTKLGNFEQPLVYDISKKVKDDKVETITVVMYDIAGEVFKNENMTLVGNYAPFVKQSDGIILLVDPKQFAIVAEQIGENNDDIQRPADALDNIHNLISKANETYGKPLAVCVSKMDSIVEFLPESLISYIQSDYVGESDERTNHRIKKRIFNMYGHMDNSRGMNDYINSQDPALGNALYNSYSNYEFFGFTALNCAVDSSGPVGPIHPHRIEEPILWMLSEVGFIGSNKEVCPNPNCGQRDYSRTQLDQLPRTRIVEEKGRFFGTKRVEKIEYIPVNCVCNVCGCRFFVKE